MIIFISNINNFFSQISFNTNLLETNIVNIGFLTFLFIFMVRKNLYEILDHRYQKIINTIQDADERLNKAKICLIKVNTQWSQIQSIIKEIKKQTVYDKENLLQTELILGEENLSNQIEKTKKMLNIQKQKIYKEIIQHVSKKVFKYVISKLAYEVTPSNHILIIDTKLKQLEKQI
ncbi:MAG: hypothetical protein GY791_19370 [Alphaproteobacteria bacterium]|nr:hypothetical protein [Alphaproteobacteria bacterium]